MRTDPVVAPVPETTIDALLARYEVFLLDAYGVLVSSGGALPGAAAFLERLATAGKQALIVSNDASRLPATSATRYQGFGLPVAAEQILTSGLLLRDHFAAAGLAGARCIVLGTDDSETYVREAGGVVAPFTDDSASVVVVADDDGYPLLETVNEVVTVLLRRLARGHVTNLILPNPDLIFPRGADAFGITAGAIAATLEAVLRLRDPAASHRFVPLGKPNRPMFDAALRRFPAVDPRRMVMLGDQLGTDILGAHRVGLDSVLVETGVARFSQLDTSEVRPTYTLAGLG
jgi:HAD superfamily hydrolase (TIGR01459 family)